MRVEIASRDRRAPHLLACRCSAEVLILARGGHNRDRWLLRNELRVLISSEASDSIDAELPPTSRLVRTSSVCNLVPNVIRGPKSLLSPPVQQVSAPRSVVLCTCGCSFLKLRQYPSDKLFAVFALSVGPNILCDVLGDGGEPYALTSIRASYRRCCLRRRGLR